MTFLRIKMILPRGQDWFKTLSSLTGFRFSLSSLVWLISRVASLPVDHVRVANEIFKWCF